LVLGIYILLIYSLSAHCVLFLINAFNMLLCWKFVKNVLRFSILMLVQIAYISNGTLNNDIDVN
jgi:hypothetical protein